MYDRRQIKIQTIQKLNTTQKKQTTQNAATQNYPGIVASYDTPPGNEVGLCYNAPEPTWGLFFLWKHLVLKSWLVLHSLTLSSP